MLDEFKKFAMKGNVIDMAVGIVIGSAFGQIVNSLVSDVIMPPIGLIFGQVDFSSLYVSLSGTTYETLKAAQAAGAPTINYGLFVNTVINFLIVASVLFLFVRQVNRFRTDDDPDKEPAKPNFKECPYCLSSIPEPATRCSECTSDLTEGPVS